MKRKTVKVKGVRTPPRFFEWIKKNVGGDKPAAVATSVLKKTSKAGIRRLVYRYKHRLPFDPDPDRTLTLGVGKIGGKPHGYLGRHVLDLGDRHAHAIVDIPWEKLKVALGNKARARFDPWQKYAYKRLSAELLAIRNPRPTDHGDRAIVEAALRIPRGIYNRLRASGEFDVLPDGVLARRGRKKKATNIFLMPS